jgi:uncharacterized protein GlcG (DUF336 family)
LKTAQKYRTNLSAPSLSATIDVGGVGRGGGVHVIEGPVVTGGVGVSSGESEQAESATARHVAVMASAHRA